MQGPIGPESHQSHAESNRAGLELVAFADLWLASHKLGFRVGGVWGGPFGDVWASVACKCLVGLLPANQKLGSRVGKAWGGPFWEGLGQVWNARALQVPLHPKLVGFFGMQATN